MVVEMRKSHQLKVAHGIESFAKRTVIRNIADKTKLTKDQLSLLYDKFQSVQFYAQKKAEENQAVKFDPSKMTYDGFKSLLIDLTSWMRPEDVKSPHYTKSSPLQPQSLLNMSPRREQGEDFLKRLFGYFDRQKRGQLKFEDVAIAFGDICRTDMLQHIEWLFNLYDLDKDGMLNNDEMIDLSEALLFLLRGQPQANDETLQSISGFLNKCFEFCDIIHESEASQRSVFDPEPNPTQSNLAACRRLSLSAFRAVVLAIPQLEVFMDQGISKSFIHHLAAPSSYHTQEVHVSHRRQILDQLWTSTRSYVDRVKGLQLLPKRAADSEPTNSGKEDVNEKEGLGVAIPEAQSSPAAETVKTSSLIDLDSPSKDSDTAEKTADVLGEVDRLLSELDMEYGGTMSEDQLALGDTGRQTTLIISPQVSYA